MVDTFNVQEESHCQTPTGHHKFLKGTQSRWTNKEKLNEECDHFFKHGNVNFNKSFKQYQNVLFKNLRYKIRQTLTHKINLDAHKVRHWTCHLHHQSQNHLEFQHEVGQNHSYHEGTLQPLGSTHVQTTFCFLQEQGCVCLLLDKL